MKKLGLAVALALLPATALGSVRAERPTNVSIGTDDGREGNLLNLIRSRARSWGWVESKLSYEASFEPAIGNPDAEIWTVRARVDGVPVHEPIAHALVDGTDGGKVKLLTWSGPIPALASSRPKLTAGQAQVILAGSGQPGTRGATSAQLVVLPGEKRSYLGWRIDPPTDLDALKNPVFAVLDDDGRVVELHDKLRFADVVVWEPSPADDTQTVQRTLHEIDDTPAFMDGPRFRAQNCVMPQDGDGNCVPEQVAAPDQDGNFIFPVPDLDNPDEELLGGEPFSEAALYFHADSLFNWLDGLGFPGLTCHENAETAMLTANYGSYQLNEIVPFDNAFYTGDCGDMVYMGQGQRDTAWDGDIVYHELGHGIVDRQTNGGLRGELRRVEGVIQDAGAVNEGFSDFVAAVFTGDPETSEYGLEQYRRNADNEMFCARDALGEIHADGELFSGAMWTVYEELGEPFFVSVIDGLGMLPNNTSFEETSMAILAATETNMGADAHDMAQALLDGRGMGGECARHADITQFGAGGSHLPIPAGSIYLYPPEWAVEYIPVRPGPVQLRAEFPPGMDTLDITFDVINFSGDAVVDAHLGALWKYGGPITFEYDETAFNRFQVDADTNGEDFVDWTEAGSFQITAEPEEVVYISLVHFGAAPGAQNGPPAIVANIQHEFSGPGVPEETGEDDTDTGDADTDTGGTETGDDASANDDNGKGCGCTTNATPAPWWAMVALLAIPRRRRR
jgi:MYXO-CTERM domain-containing protein